MVCGNVEYPISLLSYPRSGSYWLTYIIERLIGLEVGGSLTGFKSSNPVKITKTHGNTKSWWENFTKGRDSLILIVRNYKECIPRHLNLKKDDLKAILTDLQGASPLESGIENTDYIADLKLFDSLEYNKLLIYYEDLITDPSGQILQVIEFLKKYKVRIDDRRLQLFLERYEHHVRASLSLYRKINNPVTAGSQDKLLFYSKFLSDDIKHTLDNHLTKNFPEVTERYLSRYLETYQ